MAIASQLQLLFLLRYLGRSPAWPRVLIRRKKFTALPRCRAARRLACDVAVDDGDTAALGRHGEHGHTDGHEFHRYGHRDEVRQPGCSRLEGIAQLAQTEIECRRGLEDELEDQLTDRVQQRKDGAVITLRSGRLMLHR